MTNQSDIFLRTRYIAGELSAAILGAGTRSIGVERARTECDLHNMERNCLEMGRLLAQAMEMQMALAKQIERETWELEYRRRAVVDMRGVNIGGRE